MNVNIYLSFSIIVAISFSCTKPFNGNGGLEKNKIKVDGRNRSYLVYYPSDFDESKSYPAIIALHGRFGNGKNMQSLSNFNLIADELGLIIIYPDGIRRSWNDGRGEDAGPASEKDIDDVAFIRDLTDEIVIKHNADSDSIYACGMSNGGFMTLRLACELSDKIAAFGSVTGAMGVELMQKCNQSKKVPIMLIAGTEDELVPYGGGAMENNNVEIEGFESIFNFWGDNNNCNELSIDTLPDLADDGTSVQRYYFQNCDRKVILFKVIDGGHTWPSGGEYLSEGKIGITSEEINASRELANFFLQFSL